MNAIIFQCILTVMCSWMHPYYISMTEIEHDTTSSTLQISVRIFTDDLEKTIRKTYTGKVDLLNKEEKNNSEKLIREYIAKHLLLKADGKILNMQFDGFEAEEGSIWSYFEYAGIASIQLLEVKNTILYDYKEQQINFIHLKAAGFDETIKLDYPADYKRFSLK